MLTCSLPLTLTLLLAAAPAPAPAPKPATPAPEPIHEPAESGEPLLRLLQRIAVHLEILDPVECRYVLANIDEVRADLKTLYDRWVELRDYPPASDRMRFPGRQHATAMLELNRRYYVHLGELLKRGEYDPANTWAIREAMAEADRLHHLWDMIRDLHYEHYTVASRRRWLQELRETLGPEGYYGGRLPAAVPLRFFREIK